MSCTTSRFAPPLLGVFIAVAVTTTLDAIGLSMFSALPLLPLAAGLWYWERFSRVEMGLRRGRVRDHALALVHPFAVLGLVAGIAVVADVVHSIEDWTNARLNILVGIPSMVLGVLLTEEGFFRGWLWASLRRAGQSEGQVLIWSSVAFTLWHVSPVVLDTGYNPPVAQVPVYLVNVFVIGTVWGLLRQISGSVLVASVSHGVWNGLTYPLFGFGKEPGALGIAETAIFGPEIGVLGLGMNVVFAVTLWRWWMARRT